MKPNLRTGLGWIIALILYTYLFFFLKGAFGAKYLGFIVLISVLISFNLLIYLINRNYDKLKQRLVNQTLLLTTILLLIVVSDIYLHFAMPSFLELENSVTGEFQDFLVQGCFKAGEVHKKPGTFRILGIADSFGAVGRQEGANYHDFLRKKLQALPGGDRIDIINTGIPRCGPGYYWNTMEKHGDLFQPDFVLVGFYLGNDLLEMRFDDKFIGQYIVVPRQNRDGWRRYLSFRNYWIYQYVANRKVIMEDNFRRASETERGVPAEIGSFSTAGFLKIEQAKLRFFEKSHQKELNDRFQRDAGVLLQMKKWCDDRRIELVIAIFPAEIQVAPKMRQEILEALKVKEESLDFDYPNTLLKNYLDHHQIRYVDLTGPMREAAKSKTLYILRNTHWNKEGNKVAADIIFNYLQQQGLLKSFGIQP